MMPIKYVLENNIAKFFYDEDKFKEFHKRGSQHGDSGWILTEIDYGSKFYKYEYYGTIEYPCKELRYIQMQHDPFMDGDMQSPEQILNLPNK